MNQWMRFAMAALATWRVTHLLTNEDGPGDVVARAREKLGASELGSLMDCFDCMSMWVAVPLALYLARKPGDRMVAWLALSGTACVIEKLTGDSAQGGEHNELLWTQAPGL